jgi:hypothetical protein
MFTQALLLISGRSAVGSNPHVGKRKKNKGFRFFVFGLEQRQSQKAKMSMVRLVRTVEWLSRYHGSKQVPYLMYLSWQ